jgi:hypothetical protein
MHRYHPLRFHTRHTQPEDGERRQCEMIPTKGLNTEPTGEGRVAVLIVPYWSVLISSWRKVCKIYCLAGGAPAVHATVQCSANPSQQWRHLKENWNLNSAFEKTDRLLCRTKAYRQPVSPICANNIICKPTCVRMDAATYRC